MNTENANKPDKPAEREQFNRIMGLGSYAMGLCIFAFIGIGIYDNPRAAMKDWKTMGLFALGALVCFAIGYTTERKRLK